AVSLGMTVSLRTIALELLDQALEPLRRGLDALRRFLGTRRGGFSAGGCALGAVRGVVGRGVADRRGAQDEGNRQRFRAGGLGHRARSASRPGAPLSTALWGLTAPRGMFSFEHDDGTRRDSRRLRSALRRRSD